MHIEWTRMTAQTPVERAPLVVDIDRDGAQEILVLNRGGQILLWTLNGAPVGDGQDGAVAQLPQGHWSSRLIAAKNSNVVRHTRDYRRQGEHRAWHTWIDVETCRRHRANIARLTEMFKRIA